MVRLKPKFLNHTWTNTNIVDRSTRKLLDYTTPGGAGHTLSAVITQYRRIEVGYRAGQVNPPH